MAITYRSIGIDGDPWPAWIRALKGKPGAYVIRDCGAKTSDTCTRGEIVYVGSAAGSLYDTITRHFQQWKRRKEWWRGMRGAGHDPGLVYRRATSYVGVVVTSASAARRTESGLIARLSPRDNLVGDPSGEAPF